MNHQQIKTEYDISNDEIDLRELFAVIWQNKWIIFAACLAAAILSSYISLQLPNVYKSEVLLSPVSDNANLKIPGQLGGLAALAGVNLGGNSGADKTQLALQVLKSRSFIEQFVNKHNITAQLHAVESWDMITNSFQFKTEIYNAKDDIWLREVDPPLASKPSSQESYEKFLKVVKVSEDNKTGMVRLSVEHYSPFVARDWVVWLVNDLNYEIKTRDLAEAIKSIDYLKNQLSETNISEMRTMLFSLIEEQTKIKMLANVRDEYVFKTIDPAIVPEKKYKPSRAIIVLGAVFITGLFSVVVVMIRHFARKP